MADHPKELEIVDRLVASTDFNHMYAFRVYRKLVQLDVDTQHARTLLDESTNITLHEMPALVRELRTLGTQWSEQELLDPSKAESTAGALQLRFADLRPKLNACLSIRTRSSPSWSACSTMPAELEPARPLAPLDALRLPTRGWLRTSERPCGALHPCSALRHGPAGLLL